MLNRDAAIEWIILNQFGRRNLKPFQRVELAEQYRPILERNAKGNSIANLKQNADTPKSAHREKGETNVKLAELAGVGKESIRMGRKVIESGTEEEKHALREGKTTIAAANAQIARKCHQKKEQRHESKQP